MRIVGAASPSGLLEASWATARRDLVVWLAFAGFAVLAFFYLSPVLPATRRAALAEVDAPDLWFLSLVLLALLWGLPRVVDAGERRFWTLLAIAFGGWWIAVLMTVLFPESASSVPGYLLLEALYGGFYTAFALAIERRPDQRWRPRPTSPFLAWSALAGLIFGLIAYFVVIPVMLNWTAYDAILPSAYLYLVLDLYLAVRVAYFCRQASSPRWRCLYSLLAVTMGLFFFNDLNYSLLPALGFRAVWGVLVPMTWDLQFVILILAVRLRNHPFAAAASARPPRRPAAPREQTLGFALLFPLLHFALYGAGVLDESIRPAREGLMLAWLLATGGIALVQNRLLERGRRHLEEDAATLTAEIAWREQMAAERRSFLSELRAKEKEIERRNADMERLTYTVSHDLRSPLVTVRGFLGLLDEETERGELDQAPQRIAIVDKAAKKMARLLDELMELLRIGRVVAEPRDVELGELAHQAAALLTEPLDGRGITVAVAPDLPAVVGDRDRLLEVFQNLIDNAVKYMRNQPRPRIEIGWREDQTTPESDGGDPVFFVRDNGAGINPRDQETVFELFARLDPEIEGTGVGLALVKRIVEAHGGRVWVESEGRGRGSTFCFTLPGPPPAGLAEPSGAVFELAVELHKK